MGGMVPPFPGRFTPRKVTRYPLYRRLVWSQGRCGRMRQIAQSPGFDSRTMQTVASRYTDCAIPAHRYKQSPVERIQKHCCFSQLPRYFERRPPHTYGTLGPKGRVCNSRHQTSLRSLTNRVITVTERTDLPEGQVSEI